MTNQHSTYLIDFDDSFTMNIASVLYDMGVEVYVTHYKKWPELVDEIIKLKKRAAIILGPGPGHPREYDVVSLTLKKLIEAPNIFVMGICLGHQMIARSFGAKVESCADPQHGQKLTVNIESVTGNKKNTVQVYHSLCVKKKRSCPLLSQEGLKLNYYLNELMSIQAKNLVTYQFHPESIGTKFPFSYFKKLVQFLYNEENELSSSPRRRVQFRDHQNSSRRRALSI